MVENISPAVAEDLDLPPTSKGVAVAEIRDGYAAQVGFRKGDILVEINGEKVRDVRALDRILSRQAGSWQFSVNRAGQVPAHAAGGLAPDIMANLFEAAGLAEGEAPRPLADRLRPRALDEVVGQDHLVGAGGS